MLQSRLWVDLMVAAMVDHLAMMTVRRKVEMLEWWVGMMVGSIVELKVY